MSPTTNQWTRVIVLNPPPPEGHGLGEALRSMFLQRDWFAIELHDPFEAMAELCLREKAQTARTAWGLQRMEQIALVVQHAEHWQREGSSVRDLIEAVKGYVGNASIWEADDHDVKLLHGDPAPRTQQRRTPAAIATPSLSTLPGLRSASPALRLAGVHASTPPIEPATGPIGGRVRPAPHSDPAFDLDAPIEVHAPAAKGDDSPESVDRARITRQEIDMLLNPDQYEPPDEASP